MGDLQGSPSQCWSHLLTIYLRRLSSASYTSGANLAVAIHVHSWRHTTHILPDIVKLVMPVHLQKRRLLASPPRRLQQQRNQEQHHRSCTASTHWFCIEAVGMRALTSPPACRRTAVYSCEPAEVLYNSEESQLPRCVLSALMHGLPFPNGFLNKISPKLRPP